jgi:multidrug efflux pump subunit AcrB
LGITGTLPPLIVNYNASSVPVLQLALSGRGLTEQNLNDLAQNFLRPQLVTVPEAAIPYAYGGKQRQIQANLNSALLQSKGRVLPGGRESRSETPFRHPVRRSTHLTL